MGVLIHLPGVGLENQPFSRSKGLDIYHTVVTLRQLPQVIVFVQPGIPVYVSLGLLQSVEIALHLRQLGVGGE